ncbi:PilZ domain-containing protein [Candidatus Omnitrophota bacterium]
MWQEKRQSKRITLSLPIDYTVLDTIEKEFSSTICKNISEGGLKVVFRRFFPPKTKFLLKINLMGINKIIETMAESAWSFNIHYANTYYSGLRFQDLNSPNRKLLNEYLVMKEITKSTH